MEKEALDLSSKSKSDPSGVRNLTSEERNGHPHKSTFITELILGDDSDVEFDDDDDVDVLDRNTIFTHQQLSEEEEDEEEEEASVKSQSERTEWEGWRKGVTTPDAIPFTGETGLQVKMENSTPLDFLQLMIDEDMMQNIVNETNRYASDILRGKNLSASSRFCKWVDVTVHEMWAFFGLIIVMGLIIIEDLDEYWSTDSIYSLPLFRSVMTRDRFSLIMSFLHLNDNDNQVLSGDHSDHDPLFKVRPFITRLRGNCQAVFMPGKNVAVDESMISWRGSCPFRIYDPSQPNCKRGIKVFQLCDSATGYCSNLEVYTGEQQPSDMGVPFDVVKRLITPYLGCGRTLYVDNYYTSPELFRYLKTENTLACGTIRLNRMKDLHKDLIPKLHDKDASPSIVTDGTLNLLRYFDRREVNILTTAHADARVTTGQIHPNTKEASVKFQAVDEYNKYFGAVDRSDHMIPYNTFSRRTLKWWKKMFFHMFMLGVLNAYIIHKATTLKKLSHRIFRRELAKQMIAFLPATSPSVRMTDLGASSLLRLSARHFPEVIKPKPGAKLRHPQRDCAVCSEPARRLASRYQCTSCNVGLHVDRCFAIYHTCKDFKRAGKRKHQESS